MKRIAITIGDPAGIGPEIVVKALSAPGLSECIPVVIGDRCVLEDALYLSGSRLEIRTIENAADAAPSAGTLWLMDPKSLVSFRKNLSDAGNGRAFVGYIRKAVELAMGGKVDAVVTAPISKEAMKSAGFPWPGHTEMIAELTKTGKYAMMLAGGPLRVILVTIHVALKDVPGLVTKESVLGTIRLAKRACDMMGIGMPRIAVAGLNPHAGESGIFGGEERESIVPAIEQAKKEGILAEGPYSPDTVFRKACHGSFDIIVSMYHDQGLIPLKMIALEKGVNVTVGLPIIRTSPDHGTAYDIAWKGIADPSSMIEAIKMALMLRNVR